MVGDLSAGCANLEFFLQVAGVFGLFSMMCFVVSSYFSYKFFRDERFSSSLPPPHAGLHAVSVTPSMAWSPLICYNKFYAPPGHEEQRNSRYISYSSRNLFWELLCIYWMQASVVEKIFSKRDFPGRILRQAVLNGRGVGELYIPK